MVERVLFGPGGATELKQDDQLDALDDILDALLNATIDTSDVAALAKLEQIRVLLTGTLTTTVDNMIPAVETGLSKEVTQLLVRQSLLDIKSAVEAIAIDADTIAIDADTINLSTDELETILQTIRDNDIVAYAAQATAVKQDAQTAELVLIRDIVDADTFTKDTFEANALGINTVFPCPPGQKIRLYFFGYSADENVTGVRVQLQWEGLTPFDTQFLTAKGQPYARNIKAGNGYVDGPVDSDLEVVLSIAQTVHVNYELEVI